MPTGDTPSVNSNDHGRKLIININLVVFDKKTHFIATDKYRKDTSLERCLCRSMRSLIITAGCDTKTA